jgi:uncharacterized protein GlcG (DUF336 family)
MKRVHLTGLLCVVLALAGTASAQDSLSKFVITGDTAKKIHDFTTINLATAERIVETCEGLAQKEGVGVSIYILDNDGNHVYMDRMDGQSYLGIVTAEMKARTALANREPSKALANRVSKNPDSELQQILLGLFPNSGALPIIVNDQMIGVIGIGGSAPRIAQGWSDEICAHKALTAVIGPQPPLLEDLPRFQSPNRGNAPAPRFALPQGTIPKTTLPSEFVVSGRGAAAIYDANQISGAAAKKIAQTCRAFAAQRGGTASIYIIDTHGTLVHQERGDGQTYNDIRSALLKAQAALENRQPTSIVATQLQNDPSQNARQLAQFGFVSMSGGIPIVVDGQMIGAIGVGGAAGNGGDENCAIEGLKTAFGEHVVLPVYTESQK